MAEQPSTPFRQKSLERLSSPERLDQMLQLVDRKSWLPLGTFAGLLLIILAWSIFAKIPINVHGKGILILPHKVLQLQSAGSGFLSELNIEPGRQVKAGQLLALVSRPDLDSQLEMQQRKRRDLAARADSALLLRSEGADLENVSARAQGASLKRHIDETRRLAETLKAKELQAIAEERMRLDQQGQAVRELPQILQQQIEGQKRLYDEGLISRTELADAQESYMLSLQNVSSLEAELRGLVTRELEAEERYLERMQRVADLTFELEMHEVRRKDLARENIESATSYEQQLLDVDREIARLQVLLDREARIVAEHDCQVLEVRKSVGDVIAPGDTIGSIAIADANSPLRAVVYFAVKDGKQLKDNQRIQITPDVVKRERFGSMKGTITSVAPFPVTLEGVASVVGNRVIAETLLSGGYLIEVEVELIAAGTFSGYEWTSSAGPELKLTAGTTTTARVSVEDRRPIAVVLPFLRSATGVN